MFKWSFDLFIIKAILLPVNKISSSGLGDL